MTTAQITRRDLLHRGPTATAFGVSALTLPQFALAQGPAGGVTDAESHIREIYQLCVGGVRLGRRRAATGRARLAPRTLQVVPRRSAPAPRPS